MKKLILILLFITSLSYSQSLMTASPATTFGGILHFNGNTGLTTTLQTVYDGLGNVSALQLSTNSVNVVGTLYINGLPTVGTVTGVIGGTGFVHDTVTSLGTLSIDTTYIPTMTALNDSLSKKVAYSDTANGKIATPNMIGDSLSTNSNGYAKITNTITDNGYGQIVPNVDTLIIYKDMGYNPQYSAFQVQDYDTVGGGSLDGHAIPFFVVSYNKSRGFVNSQWGTGDGYFDHIHHDSATAINVWMDASTNNSFIFDSWNYAYHPFKVNTNGQTAIGLDIDTTVMFRVYPRNNVRYTIYGYGLSEFDSLQIGKGFSQGNINIDSSLVLGYRKISLYATALYHLDLQQISRSASLGFGYQYSFVNTDVAGGIANDTVLTFDNDGTIFLGNRYSTHLHFGSQYIEAFAGDGTGTDLRLNWTKAGNVVSAGDFYVVSGGIQKFYVAHTTGSVTSSGSITAVGTLQFGLKTGGKAGIFDSAYVSSNGVDTSLYFYVKDSTGVERRFKLVKGDFDFIWLILLGIMIPFIYHNKKRLFGLLLIAFLLISVSTFAQTKQDSINVQQKQYQFQTEVQKEQQLEAELNAQKIKAFDAWKEWQIAAQPFQQAIEQKKIKK